MHTIWGTGLLALTKIIIVVDDWVNVKDLSEVSWRIGVNIDPRRDILLSEGPSDDLDHASEFYRYGGKMGIDATDKIKSEPRSREWPQEIEMDNDIVSRALCLGRTLYLHGGFQRLCRKQNDTLP